MAAMLRTKTMCVTKHVNMNSALFYFKKESHSIVSQVNVENTNGLFKCVNCAGSLSRDGIEGLRHVVQTRNGLLLQGTSPCKKLFHSLRHPFYFVNKSTRCRHLASAHTVLSKLIGNSTALSSFKADRLQCQARHFSNGSSSGGEKGSNKSNDGEESSEEDQGGASPGVASETFNSTMGALTALTVPEYFPRVPVIAINRNPVFPRFIKMVEVVFNDSDIDN